MRRRIQVLAPLWAALLCAAILSPGCKRNYNPWAWVPPTPTPTSFQTYTPTRTPTISPTPTNTPTPTSTSTATATPTPSWTGTWLTFTPTLTFTDTNTFTITDTPTITNTPANTSTFTSTPTCGVGYLPAYTFDTDLQCWRCQAHRVDSVLDWTGSPPAGAEGGALRAYTAGMTATANWENFWVDFGTPRDLTGGAVSIRVYVTSALMGTASQIGVQPIFSSGVSLYQCGVWKAVTSAQANTWVTVSGAIPVTGTSCWGNPVDPTQIYAIGFQLTGQTNGGTGYAYVDRVWTGTAPTPTPTSTTAVTLSGFDTDADSWRAVTTSDYGWYTDPTGQGYSGTDGNPAGCFAAAFPALPNNAMGAVLRDWGTPVNWSAYAGIRFDVKVDAYSGTPGIQVHVLSGSDLLTAEGATLAWANVPGTSGTWGNIGRDFGTLTDKSQVKRVIIKLNAGGSGATSAGNLSIDNVVLY